MRMWSVMIGLTALVCLVPGPARAQTPELVRIGVVAPRGIGGFDPDFATAHFDRMLASWLHGALVRFKPGSIDPAEIEPDLATSWEASEDRLVWTFHLRPGAMFHRGFGPVTAEDVAYSLRKAADAKTSGYAGDFADFRAIEVIDPATLRIVLAQANPAMPGLLANYAGGFITSRRAAGQAAGDPSRAAIGFGPFMVGEQSPGQSLRLTANDDYFRGRPRLRGIDYRFVSTLSTSDLAFAAGELDVVEGQQDQTWIDRVRRQPNAAVDVIAPTELSWLHLNLTQPPLEDIRVRRAIALAINRPELVAWRGADLAPAARGVIPASYLGFLDAALPATDITEARRLLAEAGYPNGLKLKTIHTQNAVMLGAIQVVQSQLRRAGIDLDIQVVEHLTYHQMIRQDLSPLVHYAAARFPVADVMLSQFFHSRSIVGRPGGVTNFSHCRVADREIDAARAQPDPARQVALWRQAQREIADELCAVPLLETRQVWARRADFDYGFDFRGAMSTGPLITERSGFREH